MEQLVSLPLPEPLIANADNNRSRSLLSHDGHCGMIDLYTRTSNR
jgi:hypothetical protein